MLEHMMTDARWSELEQMRVHRLSSIHWREIKAHVYAQKKLIKDLQGLNRLHGEVIANIDHVRREVVRLVQEGAITASRGAEVLGMTTMEFRAVSNAVADEKGVEA